MSQLSYDNWTGKYGTHTHTASAASTGKTICLIPMFATYEGEYLRGYYMPTLNKVFYKGNAYSSLLDMVYPIGSVFLTVSDTNPAILLGGT